MDSKHLQEDEAGLDGLAELLHDCGMSPQGAERLARKLFEWSKPEFGEDD